LLRFVDAELYRSLLWFSRLAAEATSPKRSFSIDTNYNGIRIASSINFPPIRAMPRIAVRTVQKLLAVEPLGWRLERWLDDADEVDLSANCPLFIVGAPRTGSTLLYELLACRFVVAYLPNVAELCYRSPVLATRLCRRLGMGHRFGGRSRYGVMQGAMAPSEAGQLMRHWFSDADEVPRSANVPSRNDIRCMVRRLSKLFGGPLVSKDLFNGLRLRMIHEMLPEAVFIHMRRDPRFTAQSLLAARHDIWGDEQQWLGVRAPGCNVAEDADPIEQVVCQVQSIDAHIGATCRELGINRCVEIEYESLCADVPGTLDTLAAQLRQFGVALRDSPAANELPAHVECANRQTLDDARWAELVRTVQRVYAEAGAFPSGLASKCAATPSGPTG
jgi:LPS sulfotransferase NodH